ncbi:hypothetical protein [uncultured Brachyspira sp.]|uniref:hypothetical protein n=1 Tax=uncultured Brachyspira sp. TaxID=221953 RepID=UPI00260FE96E|nr:hypothetical protein [uncultured Brachyspira sp.]
MNNNKNIIVNGLRACKSRDDINDLFKIHDITKTNKKIELLNESMYSPETFYSSGDINEEDKLDLTIEIFLMDDWRLNERYEKAGL